MTTGKTPAARWREKGEPDPHAGKYDRERHELCLGELTDDEHPRMEDIMAGDTHLPVVYLTAAKERIRWLSRRLSDMEAQAARAAVPEAEGDLCDACGRVYATVHQVPSDVWAKVAPRPDTLGEFNEGGGMLCSDCASREAKAQGIRLIFMAEVWQDPDEVCPNCETALPEGCGGTFKDEGPDCWLNR